MLFSCICYEKSLMTVPEVNQLILFTSNLNVSLGPASGFEGNKINCFHRNKPLIVKCHPFFEVYSQFNSF